MEKNPHTVCKPGILAKYLQNEKARQALLVTKEKTLVECTTDKLWGTGFLLQHQDRPELQEMDRRWTSRENT